MNVRLLKNDPVGSAPLLPIDPAVGEAADGSQVK